MNTICSSQKDNKCTEDVTEKCQRIHQQETLSLNYLSLLLKHHSEITSCIIG